MDRFQEFIDQSRVGFVLSRIRRKKRTELLDNVYMPYGKKADSVVGSSQSDALAAGRGADILTGGDGADQFIFHTRDRFGKKGADRIMDFDQQEGDQVVIGSTRLKGLGDSPEFAISASKKDLRKLSRGDVDLIYFEPKGLLYYNQNDEKKGFGKSGGLFAIFDGSPELSVSDISLL